MQEHVLKRIEEPIARGSATIRSQSREDYWMRDVVAAQGWMASASNAIQHVAPAGSFCRQELDRLMTNDQLKGGIPETEKKGPEDCSLRPSFLAPTLCTHISLQAA